MLNRLVDGVVQNDPTRIFDPWMESDKPNFAKQYFVDKAILLRVLFFPS